MKLGIRTHHAHPVGRAFSWLAFISAIGIAAVVTVMPNLVEEIFGSETAVGYFYSVSAFILFVVDLLLGSVFDRFSKMKLFYFAVIILIAVTLALIFVVSPVWLVGFEYSRRILSIFLGVLIVLMVRDFAESKNLGTAEGSKFVFENAGWFLGPLAAGFIAASFGVSAVFIFSAGMMILLVLFFSHLHLVADHPHLNSQKHEAHKNLFANFGKYFRDRERTLSYLVSLGNTMWWQMIYIYTPLFIVNRGLDAKTVGIFLATVTIPLVLIEGHVGRLADRRGLSLPLVFGFTFVGIAAIASFVMFDGIYSVLVILLVASIGAAFVEPLQEMYFFRSTSKPEEGKLIGILETAKALGKFGMPLLGSVIILTLGFKYIFLIIGILMILTAFTLHTFRPKILKI